MSSSKALVVFGSGPGIGRTTAALFAERGFQHVILLSRDESRLNEDAEAVKKAASSNVKVDVIQLDLSADEAGVKKALDQVSSAMRDAGTRLEVVLYNGARVGPSKLLEWDAKSLENDLRITTVSLYIVLQWAVPQLLLSSQSPAHNPAFLLTSGGLYREPMSFLFSLSAAKAAQHNLIGSFHQKYEPKIHFATVVIAGVVADNAKVTTSKAISEEFWKLYEQERGVKGKLDVEMNDPDYYDQMDGTRQQIEVE